MNAFLFPGQGAQYVGMGRDLCDGSDSGKEYFDRAEQATRLPLKTLCFDGPSERLGRTDIAQPAIFTVSVAALEHMKSAVSPQLRQEIQPAYAAGLSLGEYTALYAAGAMDFETGVKLLAKRGELMQQAATAVPSAMVAVIGLDAPAAEALCSEAGQGEVLTCANFNCPGQIVISGRRDACRRAVELAGKHGARAATMLDVAGAFHSELMATAATEFEKVLDEVQFRDPEISVIANIDAQAYGSAREIPSKLLAQLTGAIRWQQSMEYLIARGVERFYEIGPGKVLTGLMRRIDRKKPVTRINALEDVQKLATDA